MNTIMLLWWIHAKQQMSLQSNYQPSKDKFFQTYFHWEYIQWSSSCHVHLWRQSRTTGESLKNIMFHSFSKYFVGGISGKILFFLQWIIIMNWVFHIQNYRNVTFLTALFEIFYRKKHFKDILHGMIECKDNIPFFFICNIPHVYDTLGD